MKKPKFNDVCVLFKDSKMMEMRSKRSRFQKFYRMVGEGACPRSPLECFAFSARKLCLWCQFFPSQATLKLLPPLYMYSLIENPDEHPANKS